VARPHTPPFIQRSFERSPSRGMPRGSRRPHLAGLQRQASRANPRSRRAQPRAGSPAAESQPPPPQALVPRRVLSLSQAEPLQPTQRSHTRPHAGLGSLVGAQPDPRQNRPIRANVAARTSPDPCPLPNDFLSEPASSSLTKPQPVTRLPHVDGRDGRCPLTTILRCRMCEMLPNVASTNIRHL